MRLPFTLICLAASIAVSLAGNHSHEPFHYSSPEDYDHDHDLEDEGDEPLDYTSPEDDDHDDSEDGDYYHDYPGEDGEDEGAPSCESISCEDDEECELVESNCAEPICPLLPECRPKRRTCGGLKCRLSEKCIIATTRCTSPPCKGTVPYCQPTCNGIRCPPGKECRLRGRIKNRSGCPRNTLRRVPCVRTTCVKKVSCKGFTCPPDKRCKVVPGTCRIIRPFRCSKIRVCLPKVPATCKGFKCKKNYHCQLRRQHVSFTSTFFLVRKCLPNRPLTCKDKVCPRGKVCKLTPVRCVRSPCPPSIPDCVDIVPPRPSCPAGVPLRGFTCGGRRGKRCPASHSCRLGVCCPVCPGRRVSFPKKRCKRRHSCPGRWRCTRIGRNKFCCPKIKRVLRSWRRWSG